MEHEIDTILAYISAVEGEGMKQTDRPTDDNAWNWVPIRNRHDKTAELRNAMRDKLNNKQTSPNYGNSFKVADSNWTSIHYPVDKSMITTGTNIPEKPVDSDVIIQWRCVTKIQIIQIQCKSSWNRYS